MMRLPRATKIGARRMAEGPEDLASTPERRFILDVVNAVANGEYFALQADAPSALLISPPSTPVLTLRAGSPRLSSSSIQR
uniref:Uncharacterized protein n=1 Tax=Ralstonia solanacearum TaxID=305 RepID=A0A0S4X0Y1_RALSL|nr:protein of unknown function [Ralstonia solanacearum]